MQLRWFQTYDKFGRDSLETLQFLDEDGRWEDVPSLRCREDEAPLYEREEQGE
jgi:hypothetical protein